MGPHLKVLSNKKIHQPNTDIERGTLGHELCWWGPWDSHAFAPQIIHRKKQVRCQPRHRARWSTSSSFWNKQICIHVEIMLISSEKRERIKVLQAKIDTSIFLIDVWPSRLQFQATKRCIVNSFCFWPMVLTRTLVLTLVLTFVLTLVLKESTEWPFQTKKNRTDSKSVEKWWKQFSVLHSHLYIRCKPAQSLV